MHIMKKFNYNVSPALIAIASTFLTLFNAICSNFGNVYYRNQFGRGEMSGTVFIIIFLVLPIFFKGYREYVWTKKGLITLLAALIINRYNVFGVIL